MSGCGPPRAAHPRRCGFLGDARETARFARQSLAALPDSESSTALASFPCRMSPAYDALPQITSSRRVLAKRRQAYVAVRSPAPQLRLRAGPIVGAMLGDLVLTVSLGEPRWACCHPHTSFRGPSLNRISARPETTVLTTPTPNFGCLTRSPPRYFSVAA